MLSYRYQSLQYSDSIRVLILHPSSNSSDPISCTIQHARLSDPSLEYEALSYTWGDSTRQQTIYLDSKRRTLLVGENCCNALRRLRHTSEDRSLWIDAICINQTNLAERSSQVRMMDTVFSSAEGVMVYLGEHNEGSRIVFEELAITDDQLQRTGGYNRPYPSEELIRELEILYQRPWFKRVWVLQEVCAKDSAILMCGSTCASFESLQDLHFGYIRNTQVTKRAWPLALEWILRPPEEFSTPQFNLWNRLFNSRACLATDARDKVFALKSLIGPAQSVMEPLINYAQPLEQCFVEVAKFLMPVLGLRILTAIRHPHERALPSWIPDWSQDLPLCYQFFTYESLYSIIGRFQHDQKHELPQMIDGKNGTHLELLVTGCEYARIHETSQVFMVHDVDQANKQMGELFSCLGYLAKSVDATVKQNNDRKIIEQLGESIFKAMSMISRDPLYGHLGRWLTYSGNMNWSMTPSSYPLMHDTDARFFVEALHQCRISLMENEELAIVPASAKEGDVVCILSGTDSPCVLRPDKNGAWKLISGDCYIFTESPRDPEYGLFLCHEFILSHREQVRDFRIR